MSSPLVEVLDDRLRGNRLLVKRDDLLDPEIPGNKSRKLKYQLLDAQASGITTLLTFGGAYSNHVRAVAAAGRRFGFDTIGVIRGEERPFNEGLADAESAGMRLHYLDRATYRRKTEPEVSDALRERFGDFYLVPEGGTAPLAVRGCIELVEEIDESFDAIICPVGTGGTLAGLAAGLGESQRALGFAVLRGAEYLDDEVSGLHRAAIGRTLDNWSIDHRYHCGGFAKRTAELDRFIDDFEQLHGLRLDWVYVAKAMLGLFSRIAEGTVGPAATLVFVVTGPSDLPSSEPIRRS